MGTGVLASLAGGQRRSGQTCHHHGSHAERNQGPTGAHLADSWCLSGYGRLGVARRQHRHDEMGYDVVDIEPVGEADDTDDPDVDVDDVAGVDDVRGPADAIVDELTAAMARAAGAVDSGDAGQALARWVETSRSLASR